MNYQGNLATPHYNMPSVQKKIRDLQRVLKRKSGDGDEVIISKIKAQIETLKGSQAESRQVDKEKKLSAKYRMVKFVERKKVTRKVRMVDTKIREETLSGNAKKDLVTQREQLELDLTYIM